MRHVMPPERSAVCDIGWRMNVLFFALPSTMRIASNVDSRVPQLLVCLQSWSKWIRLYGSRVKLLPLPAITCLMTSRASVADGVQSSTTSVATAPNNTTPYCASVFFSAIWSTNSGMPWRTASMLTCIELDASIRNIEIGCKAMRESSCCHSDFRGKLFFFFFTLPSGRSLQSSAQSLFTWQLFANATVTHAASTISDGLICGQSRRCHIGWERD
jgi:hypothetical protein